MASGSASFIDLTEEPDSPVLQTRSATRSGLQGQGEPGQSVHPAQPSQVIDLTEIDDDDGDVVISGSRALPPRRPWPNFDLLGGNGNDNSNGNGGNALGGPLPGARQLLGLRGTFGGLERLSRITNFALDSIPSLGSSMAGADGSGSGSGSGSRYSQTGRSSSAWRSGGPPRRSGRQPSAYNHFRTAPNPLGGNQPDLNYQSNGNAAHLDEHLQQQYMLAELSRQQRMQQDLQRAQIQFADEQAEAAALLAAHAVLGMPSRRNHFGGGASASAAVADPNKPPYVAPPEPPSGFTRNMGEDTVAVCVGCDEELVYDSNQAGDASGTSKDGERPSKRRQSRKDREEHPFWGVTGCGHVYCRRCFDNRRNALKAARPGQPPVEFKTDGRSIFCAAEGCSVDVTGKKAWVGLFV